MLQIFGQREITLVKELTKCYETIYRASLNEVLNWLQQDPVRQKGELFLVLAGAPRLDKHSITPDSQRIFNLLQQKLSLKDASAMACEITGISKKVFYKQGLTNKTDKPRGDDFI